MNLLTLTEIRRAASRTGGRPVTSRVHVQVEIRGKLLEACVVKPPFVRFGKPQIETTTTRGEIR